MFYAFRVLSYSLYVILVLIAFVADISRLRDWSCSGLQTECTNERTRTIKPGVADMKTHRTILTGILALQIITLLCI